MTPTSELLGECPAHVEQGPWSSNSRGLYQDTCRAPLALPLTRSPPPWTQWCLSPAGCTGWRAMTRGPRAPTPTQEGPSHLRVVVPQPHRHEVAIHGEQLQRKLVLSHHGVHTVLQVPQVKLHRLAEGLHGCPGGMCSEPRGPGRRTEPSGAPSQEEPSHFHNQQVTEMARDAARKISCSPRHLPFQPPLLSSLPLVLHEVPPCLRLKASPEGWGTQV